MPVSDGASIRRLLFYSDPRSDQDGPAMYPTAIRSRCALTWTLLVTRYKARANRVTQPPCQVVLLILVQHLSGVTMQLIHRQATARHGFNGFCVLGFPGEFSSGETVLVAPPLCSGIIHITSTSRFSNAPLVEKSL